MAGQAKKQRPGDIILDRYMTDATPEARENARENLRRLARLIIRVHERLAAEGGDNGIRADGAGAVDSESLTPNV